MWLTGPRARNGPTPFARVKLLQVSRFIPLNTSRTSSRIFLSGWSTGTRASGEMYEIARPDPQKRPTCRAHTIHDAH